MSNYLPPVNTKRNNPEINACISSRLPKCSHIKNRLPITVIRHCFGHIGTALKSRDFFKFPIEGYEGQEFVNDDYFSCDWRKSWRDSNYEKENIHLLECEWRYVPSISDLVRPEHLVNICCAYFVNLDLHKGSHRPSLTRN